MNGVYWAAAGIAGAGVLVTLAAAITDVARQWRRGPRRRKGRN